MSKATGEMKRDGHIVLVTGATGFIGTHLVRRLENDGWKVRPFSRRHGEDILNPASFQPLLRETIAAVVHLAAITYVPDSWSKADLFYAVNTLGTQHALEFCHNVGARMIYVSAYVYGPPVYVPIDEAHPVAPNNPYSHSKWMGEELCRFYSDFKGVDGLVLRPFNLFGPGQHERFLIPTILRQAKDHKQIVVMDDTPKRDYLHVSDFADACAMVLGRSDRFRTLNVGSGTSLSVRDIMELVRKHSGEEIQLVSLGERRVNEIMDTVADCTALKQALGWTPKRTLEDFVKEEMQCVSR